MATATSKIDAVYARYSSHGQDGNTSVEVQVEECERAAGRKLVPYIDRACTGRATAQRAELLRLLDDAEKGRVGTLWLFKWDRLARNLGQATVVMEQMQDFGVEVRVANGTDHPLVRNIELAVAEDYSRVLAERALKGMVKRAEQGRWVGGKPPYGYSRVIALDESKRLIINPDEAENVRWMFRRYLEGAGLKRLTRELHGRGIRPRKNPVWTFTSVRSILVNPVYTGRLTFGKKHYRLNRRTGRRVVSWTAPEAQTVFQDESLRLISDADFKRVRERIATRTSGERPKCGGIQRALTGLVFCPECGHVLYARRSKDRTFLYCGHRIATAGLGCSNDGSHLEKSVVDDLFATFWEMVGDTEAIVQAAVGELRKRLNRSKNRVIELRREIAEAEREIGATTRLLADPDIEATAKRAIAGALTKLQESKDAKEKELADIATDTTDADMLEDTIRLALTQVQEGIRNPTPERLHLLFEQFVGPMELDAAGLPVQRKRPAENDPRGTHLVEWRQGELNP